MKNKNFDKFMWLGRAQIWVMQSLKGGGYFGRKVTHVSAPKAPMIGTFRNYGGILGQVIHFLSLRRQIIWEIRYFSEKSPTFVKVENFVG